VEPEEEPEWLDNLFEETVTGDGTLTVKSTHTAVPVEDEDETYSLAEELWLM